MKHSHEWGDTGNVRYTCPAQYEQRCSCGKVKWVERGEIPQITLTEEEMKKRYPKLFKENGDL